MPNGISTKNFYDHKEIGRFFQGEMGLKRTKNRKKSKYIVMVIK